MHGARRRGRSEGRAGAPIRRRGRLRSTQPELRAFLACPELAEVPHLEIETYSFAMIPAERRAALGATSLLDALQREVEWVLERLAGAGPAG